MTSGKMYEVSDEGQTILTSGLSERDRARLLWPALIRRLVEMREQRKTVFDAAREAMVSGCRDLRTRVAVMDAAGWAEWKP